MPRKASDPERRENQMIAMAIDLAEKQLREGTASSQIICHYLKAGSAKDQLEKERLRAENELIKAKKETLESAKKLEQLYQEAVDAMKRYSGQLDGEEMVCEDTEN